MSTLRLRKSHICSPQISRRPPAYISQHSRVFHYPRFCINRNANNKESTVDHSLFAAAFFSIAYLVLRNRDAELAHTFLSRALTFRFFRLHGYIQMYVAARIPITPSFFLSTMLVFYYLLLVIRWSYLSLNYCNFVCDSASLSLSLSLLLSLSYSHSLSLALSLALKID